MVFFIIVITIADESDEYFQLMSMEHKVYSETYSFTPASSQDDLLTCSTNSDKSESASKF